MPGKHRKQTISFRTDEWQRALIEQRVRISEYSKQDFIARCCIYAKITVVGSREGIDRIVDAAKETRDAMWAVVGCLLSCHAPLRDGDYEEMKIDFCALAVTIADILDGASYLYGMARQEVASNWKETEELSQYRRLVKRCMLHMGTKWPTDAENS